VEVEREEGVIEDILWECIERSIEVHNPLLRG
jgi:hypothetical protein